MKSSEFKSFRYNKPVIAGLSVLLGFTVLASEIQDSKDNRLSIGAVTCEGNEPFQLESGTTIPEIANNISSTIEQQLSESEQQLSESQQRDLRSIIINEITEQQGEDIFVEQPQDGSNLTVLSLKNTVNVTLPVNCRVYNYPF